MTPKEDAVLRIAKEYKSKGKPILIFYIQTARRPIDARLTMYFERHGMKLVYMPSTVKERVPFVQKALEEGADAILCNPNLVREGIDLLQFQATVWYTSTDDAILVDQANARNHRIGQTVKTYVYYLGYNKTEQAARWNVTAEKLAAMQSAHGDVRGGLAAILGNEDLIQVVQDRLLNVQRYDSDMTIDDLLPLDSVFTANETEQPVEQASWYKERQTWMDEHGVDDLSEFVPKRRHKPAPKAQMSMDVMFE